LTTLSTTENILNKNIKKTEKEAKNEEILKEITASIENTLKNKEKNIEKIVEKEEKNTKFSVKIPHYNQESFDTKALSYNNLFSYLGSGIPNLNYDYDTKNTTLYNGDFGFRNLTDKAIRQVYSTDIFSKMFGITPTYDPVMYEQYKLWKLLNPVENMIRYDLANM